MAKKKEEQEEDLRVLIKKASLDRLKYVAKVCNITHDKTKKEDLTRLLEMGLEFHERGSLFSANELSSAARLDKATIVNLKGIASKVDSEGLAKMHAMVSDCDHWFLAYSFYAGTTEYGFLWETPYDEIHRGYSKVRTWYDSVGGDALFTVAYWKKDPKVHMPTVAPFTNMTNVYFIGKKKNLR